jgi:hypothetical protein
VARRWGTFAREATRTAAYSALFGVIAYFGMKAVIKIEATEARLFLVGVVFAVAFGAAALLDHLLRGQGSADATPNGEPTEIWPRWHSRFSKPMVYRQFDRTPYSYVVLPRAPWSVEEKRGSHDLQSKRESEGRGWLAEVESGAAAAEGYE